MEDVHQYAPWKLQCMEGWRLKDLGEDYVVWPRMACGKINKKPQKARNNVDWSMIMEVGEMPDQQSDREINHQISSPPSSHLILP